MCGEAENGKEAIERVEELHPDVVILDLQMPIMNGLEAARRISRFAPNTAMVMFTMYESEQLWRDAQAVGIKGPCFKIRWNFGQSTSYVKKYLCRCLKSEAAIPVCSIPYSLHAGRSCTLTTVHLENAK